MVKLLKYCIIESTYSKSNCTKEEARELLENTTKEIRYTFGLGYRNPTTQNVVISNKEAVKHFNDYFSDVEEFDDYVFLNSFSGNDLF